MSLSWPGLHIDTFETPYSLQAKHLCVEIEKQLLCEDPETFGDLFLDLGEAYMANGCFLEALPFIEKLVTTKAYGKAMVWLKYGECLVSFFIPI